MRVIVLGCGSSAGVPFIGCDCPVCTSTDPKNNRTRVSVYVETDEGVNILIDSSPDLRQQALRNGLRKIDAVLYTHDHADHAHGIDDLRSFNVLANAGIPVYGNAKTLGILSQRFPYAFMPKPDIWYRPCLMPNTLPDVPIHHFDVLGVPVTCFEQVHGRLKTFGYRIGDFAYSTDVNELPDSAFEALAGTKLWVVDCLRRAQSLSHSNLERTLQWVARIRPTMAVLTHMDHDFDYQSLFSELPAGVVPGYDGMVIKC